LVYLKEEKQKYAREPNGTENDVKSLSENQKLFLQEKNLENKLSI
jgi:hypothetical protein